MKDELELKLQEDFSFMKQNRVEQETNIYKRWGCECSSGWYRLIHAMCREIADRYAKEGIKEDIVILQIKEKFASLKVHYIFDSQDINQDEVRDKVKQDVAQIIRSYEEKSKEVCEFCGEAGIRRMDLIWKRTLCDGCYEKFLEKERERSSGRE